MQGFHMNQETNTPNLPMIRIHVQGTPNPNAKKFICTADVKTTGKVSFSNTTECAHIPLAHHLMLLPAVTQIHFFENVITITQNGLADWNELEALVRKSIGDDIGTHDPNFVTDAEKSRSYNSVELTMIDGILDRDIRPALQADGGDLELVDYTNNILTIRYQGACGSCPSATQGTLEAIRYTLRSEFNAELELLTI